MKLLQAARAFGVAFALVMTGVIASFASNSAYWQNNTPGVTGAWLGDSNFNIYTLWVAHARDAGHGYTSGISASQTSAQANCTQLNNDAMQQVSTSASTGYVCLPTAVSGKVVFIAMVPSQTLDIYSSATSYVSGTADTINGTAGTTAYTGNTGGNKQTICFTPNNGAWSCLTGS
jgi:hypothetical protein